MTTTELVPVGKRTLEELAQAVNEGHAQTMGHLRRALDAALVVGAAILEARDQFDQRAPFLAWLEANTTIARTTADNYVRLAYYREHLPRELIEGNSATAPSMTRALEYIRGLPPVGLTGGRGADRRLNYDEARRLVESGVPRSEAARLLGVAPPTLRRALMTAAERKRFDLRKTHAQKQRRAAFDRAQANKLARKEGGALAETYSLLRKALDAAQSAHDQSNGPQRQAIASAINRMHNAEDHIGAALRNVD